MKRFSDIPSVVHAFAHQTYPACETYNRNVQAHGRIIYSYGRHFPMGRMLLDKNGEPHTVLLTWRTYSNSTRNHQSKLRQAVRHLQTLSVYNPEEPFGREAIAQTIEGIREHLRSAAKRRAAHLKEGDVLRASYLYTQLNDVKAIPELAPEWKRVPAETKREWARLGKLLIAATEDADAALASMSAADKKAAAAADRRAKSELKKRTTKATINLEAWLSGDTLGHTSSYDIKQVLGYDALRLSQNDPEVVQTTQGAIVPAADCRKVWPMIQKVWANPKSSEGVEVDRKIAARYRLGNYTISRFTTTGGLHVGCHYFPRWIIERLAAQLGLTNGG